MDATPDPMETDVRLASSEHPDEAVVADGARVETQGLTQVPEGSSAKVTGSGSTPVAPRGRGRPRKSVKAVTFGRKEVVEVETEKTDVEAAVAEGETASDAAESVPPGADSTTPRRAKPAHTDTAPPTSERRRSTRRSMAPSAEDPSDVDPDPEIKLEFAAIARTPRKSTRPIAVPTPSDRRRSSRRSLAPIDLTADPDAD
ncbi:hypothetical protein HDU96_004138, partial [Phlyctochytrium bullatum]